MKKLYDDIVYCSDAPSEIITKTDDMLLRPHQARAYCGKVRQLAVDSVLVSTN